MGEPGFWEDLEKSRDVNSDAVRLKENINYWENLLSKAEDINVLFELAVEEEDSETLKETEREIKKFRKKLEKAEIKLLFTEKDDSKNAIMTIHSGAGGTEAQDWTEMLLRMYRKYFDANDFKYQIIDILSGDEAGVKSCELEVKGEYAYGILKAESGVHRLVRISPFDSNSRRHTSFASVSVIPEIDDNIEIEINDKDLRIDTYHASGCGGQHVNTTDSAVRIVHLPTGITVQCQAERSQLRNRDMAMKMLKSRLYNLELEKQKEEQDKIFASQKKIEWGSQIRSYVFHPYNMVKDHRTNAETSNTQAVMDGSIDMFISAFLKKLQQDKKE